MNNRYLSKGAKTVCTKTYKAAFNAAAFLASNYLSRKKYDLEQFIFDDCFSEQMPGSLISQLNAIGYDRKGKNYFDAIRFFQENCNIAIGFKSKIHPNENGLIGQYGCFVSETVDSMVHTSYIEEESLNNVIKKAIKMALNIVERHMPCYGLYGAI